MRAALRDARKKAANSTTDTTKHVVVDSTVSWGRSELTGRLQPTVQHTRTVESSADSGISASSGFLRDGPQVHTFQAPLLSASQLFSERHAEADDSTFLPDAALQAAGEHVARAKYPSVGYFHILDRYILTLLRTTPFVNGGRARTCILQNYYDSRHRHWDWSVLASTPLHAVQLASTAVRTVRTSASSVKSVFYLGTTDFHIIISRFTFHFSSTIGTHRAAGMDWLVLFRYYASGTGFSYSARTPPWRGLSNATSCEC